MNDIKLQHHTIEPFYDKHSQILILGSFPSVKSRESGFYYGHPQNRFWRVLAELYNDTMPNTISEKKAFLRKHKIALWDVIEHCEISGSSDSSIKNAVYNDIGKLISESSVTKIFANGKLAYKLYMTHIFPDIGIKAICLPSTSPANASYSLDKLITNWKVID